jgi:uncharacterized membrane protein YsdA (DUF1294 family)
MRDDINTGFCIVFYRLHPDQRVGIFSLAHDKFKAKNNTWRTSENRLLFFALLGPFGAYAAMQVFRHKTRKLKFYLVPVCAMLHIALIIWFLMYFMN